MQNNAFLLSLEKDVHQLVVFSRTPNYCFEINLVQVLHIIP
jgi:hypothetical protein